MDPPATREVVPACWAGEVVRAKAKSIHRDADDFAVDLIVSHAARDMCVVMSRPPAVGLLVGSLIPQLHPFASFAGSLRCARLGS